MRIVDRQTFLAMPAGTVYAKYEPCCFEELSIKGDTINDLSGRAIDFLSQQIVDAVQCRGSDEFFSILDAAQNEGKTVTFDFNCEGRDGCFDYEQLFSVWDAIDVAALIARLQATLVGPAGRV